MSCVSVRDQARCEHTVNQHAPKILPSQTLELFGGSNKAQQRRGAFTDNMKLPVHRWFRYSAGFSAEWCAEIIENSEAPRSVLDPFAGSGTTLLAAQSCGVEAHGFEAHNFVSRVAHAKLGWSANLDEFEIASGAILQAARNKVTQPATHSSPLLDKCFTELVLADLFALKDCFLEYNFKSSEVEKLVWLLITSILRECSHVGTAQWQYVLPNKTKAKVRDPFVAFSNKAAEMRSDMAIFGSRPPALAVLHEQDARSTCDALGKGSVDLVITSPPYPNNYDYADATRLEMSFWGEVQTWSDLHGKVRRNLVTSCSQHSSADRLVLDEVLADPVLDPIRDELTAVCRQLAAEREQKAGKKTYHTMVAAYFRDLGRVWEVLRYHVADGGRCYFVVGDSAPYGVYVPVEKWLGELALAAGFHSWSFEKFRDRNTKWKNRKHQVPLKEGVLFIEG